MVLTDCKFVKDSTDGKIVANCLTFNSDDKIYVYCIETLSVSTN